MSRHDKDAVRVLKNLDVVLAGYASIQNIETLREYLAPRVRALAYVVMSTVYSRSASPELTLYRGGEIVLRLKPPWLPKGFLPLYRYLLPFLYLFHVCLFVLSTLRFRKSFHLYLGVGYQSALAGTVLKRLNIVKRTIYYSFDYFPTTPSMGPFTKLTTRIFQQLDMICASNSNIVWNLSEDMQKVRNEGRKTLVPQIWVPHPIKISLKAREAHYNSNIAFIGGLRPSQGADLIIDALPLIVRDVPSVKLVMIGSGPLEAALKRKAAELGVSDRVNFLGFVPSEERVEEILASSAFGLAPYQPKESHFIRYADPAKIKKYLSCGLPVIFTSGSSSADVVQRRGAGIVISYDRVELAKVATYLLTHNSILEEYRENALALASEFDVERIFDGAFAASQRHIR